MILLDSDHISVLRYRGSERSVRLLQRLESSNEHIGTTIINVEESMRGWLAVIAKERLINRQISAYRELSELFDFYSGLVIATLDQLSADTFVSLPVKVASMDRKIAAIALTTNSLLLTANTRDFSHVPGLRFENWLD